LGNYQDRSEIDRTLEAVALRSRTKLLALLAARFGDLSGAEDALSAAFASALSTWPQLGCPANPEAWLLTAARRKWIDQMRLSHEIPSSEELETVASKATETIENEIPDRRLALLLACAHPAIDPSIHAPLMLQVVLGLEASQIASVFLVSPAAMAQRLVRAKVKIRDTGIPFTIPDRNDLPARLEAVLEAIYACFCEGWADPAETDLARSELAEEALFLGRLLAELAPDQPEALGLLALMLYTEARRFARRTAEGKFVPLALQNPALWNRQNIEEAEALLRKAGQAGIVGRYQLEAAIQSAHIEGALTKSMPWKAIVSLYDGLVNLTASPVASINRALALAELAGARAGLAALEVVSSDPRLNSYQPYWAASAHLLARTGSYDAARRSYQLAIGLSADPAVREYLQQCSENLPV